jgi:hypothetical protein
MHITTVHVLNNEEAPEYDSTWVTVFGFLADKNVLSAVLQEFQGCGNITTWLSPPAANCNWVYIQFEAKHGAQRALKKNGQKLGLHNMMVGVQPLSEQDKQFLADQSSHAWTSAGIHTALPERRYVVASTGAKVCLELRSCYSYAVLNNVR